MICAKIN